MKQANPELSQADAANGTQCNVSSTESFFNGSGSRSISARNGSQLDSLD